MRAAGSGLDDELLVGAKRACFGDRDIATLTGLSVAQVRGASRPDRAAAGVRDGRHLGRRVRRGDALLLLDLRRSRLAAGGATGRTARVAGHRLRPGAHRPGHRVRLLRGAGVRLAAPARTPVDHGQLQPRDGVDRLRRVVAAVLRVARRGERDRGLARRGAGRGAARRLRPVRRPDTARAWPRPLAEAGIELRGLDLDAIDQTEERMRFAGLVERLGIPQPQGGRASSVDEAFVVAERVGYPVICRPSFVIGGLAVDFAYGPE